MSWFSKLAKIAGIAAAPFTGGTSLLATGLGVAGEALSGGAEAAAQNRNAVLEAELAAEQLSQARRGQYFNEAEARERDRQISGAQAFEPHSRPHTFKVATRVTPPQV